MCIDNLVALQLFESKQTADEENLSDQRKENEEPTSEKRKIEVQGFLLMNFMKYKQTNESFCPKKHKKLSAEQIDKKMKNVLVVGSFLLTGCSSEQTN